MGPAIACRRVLNRGRTLERWEGLLHGDPGPTYLMSDGAGAAMKGLFGHPLSDLERTSPSHHERGL